MLSESLSVKQKLDAKAACRIRLTVDLWVVLKALPMRCKLFNRSLSMPISNAEMLVTAPCHWGRLRSAGGDLDAGGLLLGCLAVQVRVLDSDMFHHVAPVGHHGAIDVAFGINRYTLGI